MSVTKIYRIGKKFADDHWARDRGETDVIVKETKTTYVVRLDAIGYDDMVGDADCTWDARDEYAEWGGQGICDAAKRTLDALVKQGPPDGYEIKRTGSGLFLCDATTGQRVCDY